MTRSAGFRSRKAFVTFAMLAIMSVLLLIAVAIGRFALRDLALDRYAAFRSLSDQTLLSARMWSRANVDKLNTDWRTLAVDEMLPSDVMGVVELRRDPSSVPPRVECRIRLTRGHRSIRHSTGWPMPPPGATGAMTIAGRNQVALRIDASDR